MGVEIMGHFPQGVGVTGGFVKTCQGITVGCGRGQNGSVGILQERRNMAL